MVRKIKAKNDLFSNLDDDLLMCLKSKSEEKNLLVKVEIEDLELYSYLFEILKSDDLNLEDIILILVQNKIFYKTLAILLKQEESENFKEKVREQILYSKSSKWLDVLEKDLPLFVETIKKINKDKNLRNKIKKTECQILKNVTPDFEGVGVIGGAIVGTMKNFIEVALLKEEINYLSKMSYSLNLNLQETIISGVDNLEDMLNF